MQALPRRNARRLHQCFTGRDVGFVLFSGGDKPDKWQRVLAAQRFTGPGSGNLRAGPEDAALIQTYW